MASKRTLQREIKKARANAAEQTGNDDYRYISTHDFRAYFATNMLIREGVEPETVMEVGGWENRDSMKPYVNASFNDIIQRDLAQAGVLDVDVDTEPTPLEEVRSELDSLHEEMQEVREEIAALRELIGDADPRVTDAGGSER